MPSELVSNDPSDTVATLVDALLVTDVTDNCCWLYATGLPPDTLGIAINIPLPYTAVPHWVANGSGVAV